MREKVDRLGYKYLECPACTGWMRLDDEQVRGFDKYDKARRGAVNE
jgi:hypothetical protein